MITVKRGFLFGLGSFFILGVIAGLSMALRGVDSVAGLVGALIFMPLSIAVIRAAKKAVPNRSKLHAVVGWLIGFFVIDASILAVVGVKVVVPVRLCV